MKTLPRHTLITAALLAASMTISTASADNSRLTIHIDGLENDRGQAVFVLMDSAASHAGDAPIFAKVTRSINGRAASTEFDLPAGDYSAVVYHDRNANDELDTGLFGKPKEPYGFSNDARNAFGIPDYAEARFDIGSDPVDIHITAK